MVVFFFFQAEDGIRDLTVTGVQTCALPISPCHPATGFPGRRPDSPTPATLHSPAVLTSRLRTPNLPAVFGQPQRSGPECSLSKTEEHTTELPSQPKILCPLLP